MRVSRPDVPEAEAVDHRRRGNLARRHAVARIGPARRRTASPAGATARRRRPCRSRPRRPRAPIAASGSVSRSRGVRHRHLDRPGARRAHRARRDPPDRPAPGRRSATTRPRAAGFARDEVLEARLPLDVHELGAELERARQNGRRSSSDPSNRPPSQAARQVTTTGFRRPASAPATSRSARRRGAPRPCPRLAPSRAATGHASCRRSPSHTAAIPVSRSIRHTSSHKQKRLFNR